MIGFVLYCIVLLYWLFIVSSHRSSYFYICAQYLGRAHTTYTIILYMIRPIIITLPPTRHYHATPTYATHQIATQYQMIINGKKIG